MGFLRLIRVQNTFNNWNFLILFLFLLSRLVFSLQLRAQLLREQNRRSMDPEGGLQQPPAAGHAHFHVAGPAVSSSTRPPAVDAGCDPMASSASSRASVSSDRHLVPLGRHNEGGRQVAAAVNAAFERFIHDTTAGQTLDEVVAMASFADRKGERQCDLRVTLSPPPASRNPPPVKKRTVAIKPASHRAVRDSAPGALPHEVVVHQLPAGTRFEPRDGNGFSSSSSNATGSTRGSGGTTVGDMAMMAARSLGSGGGPVAGGDGHSVEMGPPVPQHQQHPSTAL